MDSHELSGKVVLVTGGSRGIGRALALGAVSRGARVAFCSRHVGEEARQVLQEAESLSRPGAAIVVQADVSREEDVDRLFDSALAAFGRLDIVVNNAGIYNAEGGMSASSLILQVPTADWDEVIATNLTGAFLVARRAIREFLARGIQGSIISIGSVSQDGGTGLVSYAASKAGLEGLTRLIARQYGDRGIRACMVAAAYVDTGLNKDAPEQFRRRLIEWGPQKRAGLAEEIASTALFLASPRSALPNGATVFASGGARDVPAYLVEQAR